MTLKFSCNWLERPTTPSQDELEATMAALRILIDGKNVTAYAPIVEGERNRSDERVEEKLHIPVYFLAEWIAENWWPLLYEPRKTEGSDDVAFHSRHSLLHAQHGFALPDVQIEPLGEAIRVSCRGRDASVPGVRFRTAATVETARKPVQAILLEFVRTCIERLTACGIAGTPLQQAWQDISQTGEKQVAFCVLVGALGVSPYGATAELAAAIDRIYESVGERAALDLCMASSESDILSLEAIAASVAVNLNGPHESTIAPLEKLMVPNDNISLPSWRRGKNAAINVRKLLDIRTADHLGADKFFDKLKISAGARTGQDSEEVVFTGGVDRIDYNANIVLLQSHEEARRFAASRAVFLAMASEPKSRRLVTNAMTRDQQASRAFAAEILVPSEYLRAQSRSGKMSRDSVYEVARKWRASVDVVKYQATNNGLLTQTSF